MHKRQTMVALGLILLAGLPVGLPLALPCLPLALPCLADDTAKGAKGSAAATASAADKDGDSDGGAAGGRKHGGGGKHQRRKGAIPGKNQVMNVADLTAKQKSQLQAIYDAKKPQFVDLRKQMQALEADEWKEVQGVLTPAQIEALGGKSPAPAAAADASSSAKDASAGGDK